MTTALRHLLSILEHDPNVSREFVKAMTTIEDPNRTPFTDPRATRFTAAACLRELAEWVDRHELTDADIVAMTCDGWNEMHAHLKLDAARRLWPGRTVPVLNDGYAKFFEQGVCVVFCAVPKGVVLREMTL